jgi:hypothetical protein
MMILLPLAIVVILGTSCGPADLSNEIKLDLTEFTIGGTDSLLAAGAIEVTGRNLGELPHTLAISTVDGEVITGSDVIAVGESGIVSVTLSPGEYEFTCRIVAEFEGELVDHYELGMVETVTVVG